MQIYIHLFLALKINQIKRKYSKKNRVKKKPIPKHTCFKNTQRYNQFLQFFCALKRDGEIDFYR